MFASGTIRMVGLWLSTLSLFYIHDSFCCFMSLVLLIVLSLFVFVSFLVFVHFPCFLWESVLSVYISQSQVSVYFLSVSFFVFLFVSLCISLPHPLCLSHLPCHVPLLVFHPLSPQVCLPCMLPCLLILISASSSCVLVAFQNFWILQRFGLPPVRIK